jgi:hypothetical protein
MLEPSWASPRRSRDAPAHRASATARPPPRAAAGVRVAWAAAFPLCAGQRAIEASAEWRCRPPTPATARAPPLVAVSALGSVGIAASSAVRLPDSCCSARFVCWAFGGPSHTVHRMFPWDLGGGGGTHATTSLCGWCPSFQSQQNKTKSLSLCQVKNNQISRDVKGLFLGHRFVWSRVIFKVTMMQLEDELLGKGWGNVRCQGSNGPGGPLGLGSIRSSSCLGVK